MAPIVVAKNGFQKDHDFKNSLIVRGLGFTTQLFSIIHFQNCLSAKLIKENIKSLQCHLNLFSDTYLFTFAPIRINL